MQKFDIVDSTNNCRAQNLQVIGDEILEYELAKYVEQTYSAGPIGDNFANNDNVNCPHEIKFLSTDMTPVTSIQNMVLGFNDA